MTTAETPPTTEPQADQRPVRLVRSSTDRVIAGVCGGLGRYFGIDPIIFRIAFVVLVFAGGAGILGYVIAWIAIPAEKPGEPVETVPREGGRRDLGLVAGFVLVVLGSWLLASAIAPDVFSGEWIWPLVLIVLGLVVLARAARR